jgi:hypothetical protein
MAARAKGTHSEQEWREMKRVYKGRCVRCNQKPYPNGRLTKDHVIPVSCGGSDLITNIQPLCSQCNSRKRTQFTDYRMKSPLTPAKYLPKPLDYMRAVDFKFIYTDEEVEFQTTAADVRRAYMTFAITLYDQRVYAKAS